MAQELTIASANAGRRVETVVRSWLAEVPRTRLLKWLRNGTVRLNGKRTEGSARLEDGDVLMLRLNLSLGGTDDWGPYGNVLDNVAEDSERAQAGPAGAYADASFDDIDDATDASVENAYRKPGRQKLLAPDVVYEDGDMLVVNKPAGLAAHPGIGHDEDSLTARLEAYLGCGNAPVGERVGLAQRLDAGVSGLLPCGKHARALKVMMGPPHGPKLDKIYLAVVAGEVEDERGSITLPLRSTDAPRGNVPKAVVDRISGRPAHTDYVVLARFTKRTLIALRLHTGRTHQIRAHLRAIGHPLLGDPRYGEGLANEWARQSHGVRRPLLHAAHLTMVQPITGVPLQLSAPLPPDMARLCAGRVTWPSPWAEETPTLQEQ